MRLRLLVLCWFLLTGAVAAHIGSPAIFYEAQAGAYKVLVMIRPPDVVPGTAQVDVRVDRDDITRVTIQPIYFGTGTTGAPRPDEAARVPGDPRLYSGMVWLMEFGSASVSINVEGPTGPGHAVVPVPAVATARRSMDGTLILLLAGLGLVLIAGALALVDAGAREAVVAPGVAVPPARRRRIRARIAVYLVIVLLLVVGHHWWGIVDAQYLHMLYKPMQLHTEVRAAGTQQMLRLTLAEPGWLNRQVDDLLPDHGKLMHLFLVREPALDAFAHLHPMRQGATTFEVMLPPLPPGPYRVYADVVHANGLTETLAASTNLPLPQSDLSTAVLTTDPDDAWLIAASSVQTLSDGSTMTWEQSATALQAGQVTALQFSVRAPQGPTVLEPYMGMLGHAIITRDDGAVFVHLHPVGTVSMAAQQAFTERGQAAHQEGLVQAPGRHADQPMMGHHSMPHTMDDAEAGSTRRYR